MKTKNPKRKEQNESELYLLEFYGQECPHCNRMKPIIEQVEKELKVQFSKLEVWHSEENHKVMEKYAEILEDACRGSIGVPSFCNTKTKKGTIPGPNRVV